MCQLFKWGGPKMECSYWEWYTGWDSVWGNCIEEHMLSVLYEKIKRFFGGNNLQDRKTTVWAKSSNSRVRWLVTCSVAFNLMIQLKCHSPPKFPLNAIAASNLYFPSRAQREDYTEHQEQILEIISDLFLVQWVSLSLLGEKWIWPFSLFIFHSWRHGVKTSLCI